MGMAKVIMVMLLIIAKKNKRNEIGVYNVANNLHDDCCSNVWAKRVRSIISAN